MASLWLFFRPARLPLTTAELDAATVINLRDDEVLRAALASAFTDLTWESPQRGRATHDGNWYEVRLPENADSTLSLRCSLRADHAAFVQSLCDRFGWIAFDERPMCFQPHREPMAA